MVVGGRDNRAEAHHGNTPMVAARTLEPALAHAPVAVRALGPVRREANFALFGLETGARNIEYSDFILDYPSRDGRHHDC